MNRNTLTRKKAEDYVETLTATRKDFFHSGMKFTEDALLFCAAQRQAKRFYVSTEEAVRKINNYEKTGSFGVTNAEKLKMYTDIYNKYIELRDKWTKARRKIEIIHHIVHSPAPAFYASIPMCRHLQRIYYNK